MQVWRKPRGDAVELGQKADADRRGLSRGAGGAPTLAVPKPRLDEAGSSLGWGQRLELGGFLRSLPTQTLL